MSITSIVFGCLISISPLGIFVFPNCKTLVHHCMEGNFRELPPTIIGLLAGVGLTFYPWFLFFPDYGLAIGLGLAALVSVSTFFFWYTYRANPSSGQIKLPKVKFNFKSIGVFWKNRLQSLRKWYTHWKNLNTSIKNKKRIASLAKQPIREQKAQALWATFDEQDEQQFWKTYEKLLKQTHRHKS